MARINDGACISPVANGDGVNEEVLAVYGKMVATTSLSFSEGFSLF